MRYGIWKQPLKSSGEWYDPGPYSLNDAKAIVDKLDEGKVFPMHSVKPIRDEEEPAPPSWHQLLMEEDE